MNYLMAVTPPYRLLLFKQVNGGRKIKGGDFMKPEKWELFSNEELREILLTSKTFKEVAQKLGYQGCNGRISDKIRRISKIA